MLIICSILFPLSADITNWKGMEHGLGKSPKWIRKYLKNQDDSILREKFDIEDESIVIVGIGKASNLETARTLSQTDAMKKAKQKSDSINNIQFQYIYEYWEKENNSIYFVYTVYELMK